MDSDIYGGDINTYGVLFEPPAELQCKIGMFKGSGEVTAMAEIYLGHSRCNENLEYMKEVLALLQAQKPHVKVYNSDGVLERLVSAIPLCTRTGTAIPSARGEKPSLRYA